MGALIAELFQRRVALVFDGEERVDEQDEGYRKMMEAAEQEAAMRERARAEQMAALRPAPAPGIPSGPAEPLKPKNQQTRLYRPRMAFQFIWNRPNPCSARSRGKGQPLYAA